MIGRSDESRGEHLGKNWQDKIRLLEAIDAMRESAPTTDHVAGVIPPHDDSEVLREKLHTYEQTCAMLEREVHVLEQQTLAALAEAGRLRRELDQNEEQEKRYAELAVYQERDLLEKRVADSETERRLLLDALENSEAELARMVKTLDMVVRKLQVA